MADVAVAASSFRMAGTSGQLRRGTATAATLGRWTLTPGGPRALILRAALADVNAYWIGQRPLDVQLDIGPRCCRWRAVDVTSQTDVALVAVLRGQAEKT